MTVPKTTVYGEVIISFHVAIGARGKAVADVIAFVEGKDFWLQRRDLPLATPFRIQHREPRSPRMT